MTIADMVAVLNAKVLVGEDKLDTPVYTACCSDLMSDVLAFVDEKTVLITGLTACGVLYGMGLRGWPVPGQWDQEDK